MSSGSEYVFENHDCHCDSCLLEDSSIDQFEENFDIDKFEILKLQNRQQSANQQLENIRNSNLESPEANNSEEKRRSSELE